MASSIPPLRQHLTLEAHVDAPDLGGGWHRRWVEIGRHFAAILPSSGAEAALGSQQAQRVTHRVVVRASGHGHAIRPRADQRFRNGLRLFDIKAVFERDPRGRYLTCLCEEHQDTSAEATS